MLLHQRRYIETAGRAYWSGAVHGYVYRVIFSELTAREPDVPIDVLAAELDEEATEVLQELIE